MDGNGLLTKALSIFDVKSEMEFEGFYKFNKEIIFNLYVEFCLIILHIVPYFLVQLVLLTPFLIDLVPVLRLPLLQATWVQVDIVLSGRQTLGCYKHVYDK